MRTRKHRRVNAKTRPKKIRKTRFLSLQILRGLQAVLRRDFPEVDRILRKRGVGEKKRRLLNALVHVGGGVFLGRRADPPRGDARNGRMRRDVVENYASRADFRAPAYCDIADELCARAD